MAALRVPHKRSSEVASITHNNVLYHARKKMNGIAYSYKREENS
jgi:hypothetical protein